MFPCDSTMYENSFWVSWPVALDRPPGERVSPVVPRIHECCRCERAAVVHQHHPVVLSKPFKGLEDFFSSSYTLTKVRFRMTSVCFVHPCCHLLNLRLGKEDIISVLTLSRTSSIHCHRCLYQIIKVFDIRIGIFRLEYIYWLLFVRSNIVTRVPCFVLVFLLL